MSNKRLTWGEGLTTGLAGGVYNAIHRIRELREHGITDVNIILDYLDKDSRWAMRTIDGFDALELMNEANGWKPGWWDTDD